MTEILPDESDLNLSHVQNSMSTDSEESFLMRQINKSQTFNNSTSSGSSKDKRPQSYFRESYIDDDGALKSFSVFQDAINETSDESRNVSLSGLSAFNIENVVAREPRNSHLIDVLNEVDNNNRSKESIVQGHRKSSSVSRSDTMRDQQLRKTHKRMSGSSFRISSYANLPQQGSSGSGSGVGSSDQNRSSSHYGSYRGLSYAGFGSPGLTGAEPERPLYHELNRVPTPDYQAPPPPDSYHDTQRGLYDEMNIGAFTSLTQMALKQKSTSTVNSYKSAYSQTRTSIMNFEDTRRKQKGTPHLIKQNMHTASAHTTVQFHDTDHRVARAEVFSDPGVTPSIHSPSSDLFPEASDDASIKNTRRAKMYSGQSVVKKPVGLKEFKLRPPTLKDTPKVTPYYIKDPNEDGEFPTDTLLEKLHYDREHRPERYHQDSHALSWIVYFVSFLVPPLFFFLGFGLLDQHIGGVDVGLKRISLLTGTFVLMLALAMIGVGFGVGITQAAS